MPYPANTDLARAAAARARIPFTGTITEHGEGYSGRYRNRWLIITGDGAAIRVTASPAGRLAGLPIGTTVQIEATLSGMLDLTTRTFHGRNVKLRGWTAAEERE